jgi:hypothetical protein
MDETMLSPMNIGLEMSDQINIKTKMVQNENSKP